MSTLDDLLALETVPTTHRLRQRFACEHRFAQLPSDLPNLFQAARLLVEARPLTQHGFKFQCQKYPAKIVKALGPAMSLQQKIKSFQFS